MGGILSPSKPKIPTVVVSDDSGKNADEAKQQALERQRRGVESTIKTSYNGVVNGNDLKRKKLLGE